jgi:ribosomal protein S18 acetylase RimI-like enzyme
LHSPLNIQFISAAAADIPLLSEMIKKLYTNENTTFIEADVHDALSKLIANERYGNAFIIHCNEKAAGYLIIASVFSVEFKGEAAFLDELYIDEEFRGNGIGIKAVEFAEKYAIEKGYKALRLEVEHTNHSARELYNKMGFAAHERSIMTKWLKGE